MAVEEWRTWCGVVRRNEEYKASGEAFYVPEVRVQTAFFAYCSQRDSKNALAIINLLVNCFHMRRTPAVPITQHLDAVFAALSDASRRHMLERLRQGEATVGELAEPLDMSLPAVSKHLRVLENAGLLKRRVDGRLHYISANAAPLDQAMNWMEQQRRFWTGSFQRLDKLFRDARAVGPSTTAPTSQSHRKPKTKPKL
jgi:DNA-binding transcriptional ArsR family regulator